MENLSQLPLLDVNEEEDVVSMPKKLISPLAASLNVFTLILGSSAVAAPYTFMITTPYLGVLFEALAAVVLWGAAICLFNVSKIVQCTSFLNLGEKVFGYTLKGRLLNFFLVLLPLVMIGLSAAASYIDIASDIFGSYIKISPVWLKLSICAIMFLLGLIRTFKSLDKICIITFILYIIVISFITLGSLNIMPYIGVTTTKFGTTAITSIPLFFVLLHGHIVIPGVTGEMNDSAKNSSSIVAAIAMALAAVTGIVAGFFPAMVFGSGTHDDILKQLFFSYNVILQKIPGLIIAAQVCLAISIILKIPIVFIPLKEILLDRKDHSMRECSFVKNVVATFIIIFSAGLIAIVLPNLKSVLETVGGFGSLTVTGITAGVVTLMVEKSLESKIRGICVLAVGSLCFCSYFFTVVAILRGSI